MPTMRRAFGPGISSCLPIQRSSPQAYPIARTFTKIRGQVSQYSLPIFAHYVMRWSPISLLLTPGKEADIRRSTRGNSDCASQRKRLCGKVGQHVSRRKFEKEPGSTFIQIGG